MKHFLTCVLPHDQSARLSSSCQLRRRWRLHGSNSMWPELSSRWSSVQRESREPADSMTVVGNTSAEHRASRARKSGSVQNQPTRTGLKIKPDQVEESAPSGSSQKDFRSKVNEVAVKVNLTVTCNLVSG